MGCKLVVVSGMAFEAKMAAAPAIQTVYGLNPSRLERDMEQTIAQGAAGLLSFGTAAGLSPRLTPGAIIVARRVWHHQQKWEADIDWAARLCAQISGAHCTDIAGVDHALISRQEKAALLAETGAQLADTQARNEAGPTL